MRLLLDTHVMVWAAEKDSRLSPRVLSLLLSEAELFLSVVSAWELTIKVQSGKLRLATPADVLISDQLRRLHIQPLPLLYQHVISYQQLPLHHRDPFDRMLIAQAQAEGLALVSCDGIFRKYDVEVLW